jgi:hypothetical protein
MNTPMIAPTPSTPRNDLHDGDSHPLKGEADGVLAGEPVAARFA